MRLSTQTTVLFRRIGEDATLKIYADAGYDCVDLSMFFLCREPDSVWCSDAWEEHAKETRKKCEALGMTFNQGHSPFNYKWEEEGVVENLLLPDTIKSVKIAGVLGIRDLVVHPLHHWTYKGNEEMIFEKNMEFYRKLIPYAEEAGVKISVENMFQIDKIRKYIIDDVCADPAEMNRYIDTLNSFSPVFNGCIDLGHAAVVGREPQDFIREVGPRLGSLHVQDNNYIGDQHLIPGLGRIDYMAVMQALADVDYKGDFTFEADSFLGKFREDQYPMVSKFMADIGRYWIGKFNEIKNAK